ncbi:MAG: urease accessory UreF family protein [Steroidobacteraceae bacterium]
MADTPALLRLLQLASPALPIGAFHFSQGLEHAVHAGWVRDEGSALEWIAGVAGAGLATLDLPVLARLHDAWSEDSAGAVARWSALLIASRETEELRAEDRHLGGALAKLVGEFELSATRRSVLGKLHAARTTAYATAFALATVHWGIERDQALTTYAWTWVENQTLAAVKLVPLGQTAGQRILHQVAAGIPALLQQAVATSDDDIGIDTVRLAVGSALHETQYSRLFRS